MLTDDRGGRIFRNHMTEIVGGNGTFQNSELRIELETSFSGDIKVRKEKNSTKFRYGLQVGN